MPSATEYFGMVLCVGGSWGSNMANIFLKCKDNANDARERDGEEMLPTMNYYNFMYVLCYCMSATFDQWSLTLIPQSLWNAISCLDVIWYSLFTAKFLDDPLEPLEMVPLSLICVGVLMTVLYGIEDVEKTKSGYDYLMDADLGRVLAFFPAFFTVLAIGYAYAYYNYRNVKDNPTKYPPGYMPRPLSAYNCAGIFVNGVSTACFATSMYLLNNTVLIFFNLKGAIIIALFLWLPFTALSFKTDWFAAAELHIITVVPSSLIVNCLSQFMITKVLFEDQYKDGHMFLVGILILVFSLVLYVFVEQKEFDRDRHEQEQEVQDFHDERYGVDRNNLAPVPLLSDQDKDPTRVV